MVTGGAQCLNLGTVEMVRDTAQCLADNIAARLRDLSGRAQLYSRFRDGVGITSGQIDPYRSAWEANNAIEINRDGPLWVVLGDSASQGIGASSAFDGWVGQVRGRLQAQDGQRWRVVNLSVSGARAQDVLNEQLPHLWRLAAGGTQVDLVVCAIGGNDMYRSRSWQIRDRFTQLVASLPEPGRLTTGSRTVITTLPQGLARRRASIANHIIRTHAPRRGLEVADLWATTGPPWEGKYAEDFFHPNDTGYGHWAEGILPAVLQTTATPTLGPVNDLSRQV